MAAGAVNLIRSEEEFDLVLRGHRQQLVVLEASLTWCRPCKGFDRPYQKFAEHYLNTGAPQPRPRASHWCFGGSGYPCRCANSAQTMLVLLCACLSPCDEVFWALGGPQCS
jgi:hypothetical protein